MFKKARYVLSVYREGSFTKAAKKLYISQPCLSTAIKQLEGELGAPLFERASSSVKPTELGLEYIRTAERIIELEDAFASRINDLNTLATGVLRVGGSNYGSSYVLPQLIASFSKLYQNVTVSLTETNSSELLSMLNSGDIDIIADSFDSEPDGCILSPLSNERILLAVPSSFACNDNLRHLGATPNELFDSVKDCNSLPVVSIKHFKSEKFILLKNGNSMYEHAMKVFRQAGFTPEVSLFLDQLSTSYVLTSQGNGCCFVTDTFFKYHRFDNPVILYNVDGGERKLALAYKKSAVYSPAVLKFIELCKS